MGKMDNVYIIINTDGSYRAISHFREDLVSFGEARRASHIWPENIFLRVAFILVRAIFGEGRIADWTRGWRCSWIVDLRRSKGGILGPFSSRGEAIAAEVNWLLGSK